MEAEYLEFKDDIGCPFIEITVIIQGSTNGPATEEDLAMWQAQGLTHPIVSLTAAELEPIFGFVPGLEAEAVIRPGMELVVAGPNGAGHRGILNDECGVN